VYKRLGQKELTLSMALNGDPQKLSMIVSSDTEALEFLASTLSASASASASGASASSKK
jgi:hypothetical protein